MSSRQWSLVVAPGTSRLPRPESQAWGGGNLLFVPGRGQGRHGPSAGQAANGGRWRGGGGAGARPPAGQAANGGRGRGAGAARQLAPQPVGAGGGGCWGCRAAHRAALTAPPGTRWGAKPALGPRKKKARGAESGESAFCAVFKFMHEY